MQTKNGKKVLILGGAGFIQHHLETIRFGRGMFYV